MPELTRQNDLSQDHPGSHGPRGFQESAGSPNVFANGVKAIRVGVDKFIDAHNPPYNEECVTAGSSSVFANGISVVRKGDPTTCVPVGTGSSNVFAG